MTMAAKIRVYSVNIWPRVLRATDLRERMNILVIKSIFIAVLFMAAVDIVRDYNFPYVISRPNKSKQRTK